MQTTKSIKHCLCVKKWIKESDLENEFLADFFQPAHISV